MHVLVDSLYVLYTASVTGHHVTASVYAGGVEQDSCTLQPCIEFVDTWETASEAEIAEAVIDLHTNNGIFEEGAAAMTWACARKHLAANPATAQGGVVVVCCGGNAAPTLLQSARALLDE